MVDIRVEVLGPLRIFNWMTSSGAAGVADAVMGSLVN